MIKEIIKKLAKSEKITSKSGMSVQNNLRRSQIGTAMLNNVACMAYIDPKTIREF